MSFDRYLLNVQQIVTQTHDAVSARCIAMNQLLQANISDFDHYLNLTEQESAWPLWRSRKNQYVASPFCSGHNREHIVSENSFLSAMEDQDDGRERKPAIARSIDSAHITLEKTATPGPWNLFEVSPNTFPESYTTYQLLPTCSLIVLSSSELTSSAECRTNFYQVYYLKSQRQWCMLNVTIRVHESSIYWAALRISKQRMQVQETTTGGLDSELPCSLRKQIQVKLSEHDDVIEDFVFEYQIVEQKTLQEQHKGDDTCVRQLNELPNNPHQNALAFIHDLGCPIYVENQVV